MRPGGWPLRATCRTAADRIDTPMTPPMSPLSARKPGFFYAVGVGMRSMRKHPLLAAGFIVAVVAQGFMQGLLIWAIRNVLVALSSSASSDHSTPVRIEGALVIFLVWLLRAGSAMTADSL